MVTRAPNATGRTLAVQVDQGAYDESPDGDPPKEADNRLGQSRDELNHGKDVGPLPPAIKNESRKPVRSPQESHESLRGAQVPPKPTASLWASYGLWESVWKARQDDGVFVALKPMCDSMGLTWRPQWKRLQNDAVLSEGITVMMIPSPGGALA